MKKRLLVTLWVCYISLFTFLVMATVKMNSNLPLFDNLGQNDKAAILMVHFGTTHEDTRTVTIDAINDKVKAHFPDLEVREAYTSRIIIKRLGSRGIEKPNTKKALEQLRKDGYTHIVVQPTTIINGLEMTSIREDVRSVSSGFKEVRVGKPLLFDVDDYASVIDIITEGSEAECAYVWIGHGTSDVSTSQYAMLDYMLKEKGHSNFIVGCIEGYPYYEQALKQLKALGLTKVKLFPFMLVAGEHAKNDIAEDWKADLEAEGFAVEVVMKGLGENKAIQDLYVSSLETTIASRVLNIMEKKKIYEVTGEIIKEQE